MMPEAFVSFAERGLRFAEMSKAFRLAHDSH
jgi:hypothetical protein